MFRLLALIAALVFTASGVHAAPVELDSQAEAQLANGDRARAIVWLVVPSGELAADTVPGNPNIAPGFRDVTNAVMMRVFDLPATRLAEAPPGDTVPRIVREFRYTPALAMELTRSEIDRLSQDPDVRRIETDMLARPYLNDSVPLIGATTLHNGGNTGAGAGVAILDTGVDHEHPMFAGRITASACFSSTAGNSTSLCPGGASSDTTTAGAGDNCEEPADDPVNGADGCDHGTHVAGIAAGASFTDPDDGSRTLTGVAPGANIIAVQVFSRFEDTNNCGGSTPCVLSYTSDQLAALEWLYANRASLGLASINMSLGGGKHTSSCPTNSLASIITQLRDAGVATAIASGNESFADGVSSPGCVPDAITVGSSTDADALSGFSNSSSLVDLLAPGSSIRSAQPTANDTLPGRASTKSGTSMATPHVAGAIALLRASHPTASIDAIENALEATGVPITDSRNNVTVPRIRVDLADAQLAAGGNGTVAGVMTVSPLRAYNASGSGSDAADYNTQDYTLTNTSGGSISWQAAASADWLRLAPVAGDAASPIDAPAADTEGGTLAAGASVIVRASVDPSGLTPGNHLATITFSANGQSPGLQIAAALAMGATPPVNDDFANALLLSQVSQTVQLNNVGATKETGEPNHSSSGGASLWWRWTAPVSGQVRIQTQDTNFDTMLGVYTGSSVDALSSVGQNDDINYPSDTNSRVEFAATAGTTYAIAVDGYGGASGDGSLSVAMTSVPANDNLANAEALTGNNGSMLVSNVNATRETGESQHGANPGGASIWFSWQPSESGTASLSAVGSGTSRLAVYEQNTHGATALAEASEFSNLVTFQVAAGTTYYIALDGKDGIEGLFRLSWYLGASQVGNLAAAMLPNARSITVGNTATAFATIINPGRNGLTGTNCRIEAPADFNGGFIFRRTDAGTNQPVGNDGDQVDIASGASQSYVVSITPGTPLNGSQIVPTFLCDNLQPANPVLLLNTLSLTASAQPTADIISLAATPTANGILAIPQGGAAAFSVAAVNIGAAQSITLTPGTGNATLPLTIDVCETNPGTGACLAPRAASATASFAANETRTFTIFVRATGDVPFSPASNRVFATFTNGSSTTVGATSVAVRSP
jgi:subtilisin family serine protease